MDAHPFPLNLFGLDVACPKDPRAKSKVIYSFESVAAVTCMAKAAHATSEHAIANWTKVFRTALGRLFGWPKKRYPHRDVFRTILNDTAQEEMEKWTRVFNSILKPVQFAQTCRALAAMDGKCARGAGKRFNGAEPVTMLTVFDAATGRILGAEEVGEKTNEITHAVGLIRSIAIEGKVVSADAMHCQKKFAAQILKQGGDFLLIAKENQSALHEAIAAFFADQERKPRQGSKASTYEKGHGRVEARAIETSGELNAYLADQWPGVKQVFQVRRGTIRNGRPTEETVYGISSLPEMEASPADVLELVRAHWAIEDSLHWRLDMNEDEDRMRIKSRQGAANMARINRVVAMLHARPGAQTTGSCHRMFECATPEMSLRYLKKVVDLRQAA